MTNLEALRMVRRADTYAMAAVAQMVVKQRAYNKIAQAVMNTFHHAESGLEFEVGFEGMKEEYKRREAENVEMANKLLGKIGRSTSL